MNTQVLIVSDAIGSGKTTALKEWLRTKQNIGGILTPKVNGKRVFEFLPLGETLPMEAENSGLTVGKYRFNIANFQKAESTLWNCWMDSEITTVVIDEVGPLELKKRQGFHELLVKMVATPSEVKKTLIVVVRDYCLQDFIKTYPFQHVKVCTIKEFKINSIKPPIGVVLCGGKSRRMQKDKALLEYHSMPQWNYVSHLIQPFCKEVVLSVNLQQQQTWVPDSIEHIVDKEYYKNHGPLTGVLSAIEDNKNQALLFVACDYPILRMEHILEIMKNRAPEFDVVCYKNKDQIEPLISLFEVSAFQKLTSFFESGNDSMATFIASVRTHYISVSEVDFLKNVNHLKDFEQLKTTKQ